MSRPWQTRREHRQQWAAESVEALCGALVTHCTLTAVDLRYLGAVESWARGEAPPQDRQRHTKGLSLWLGLTVEDLLQDVARHPTHLPWQTTRAMAWAEKHGADFATIRSTYAARLAELRREDPRITALREAGAAFDRGAA